MDTTSQPATPNSTPPTVNSPHLDIHRDALAKLLNEHARQAKETITKQWRMAMVTILIAFISLVVLTSIAFLLMERKPKALVEQMIVAQQEMRAVLERNAQPVTGAGSPDKSATQTAELAAAMAKLAKTQEEALAKLAQIEAQPSASSQSMVQLIGSAAVLALLGLLGLQRLQNFDAEINNVRNSVDTRVDARAKEVSDRVREIRDEVLVLRSSTDAAVKQQATETKAELERNIEQTVTSKLGEQKGAMETALKSAETSANDFLKKNEEKVTEQSKEIHEERERMEKIQKHISALLEKHPWLKQDRADEKLRAQENLRSAGEAHDQATILSRSGDRQAAKAALLAIADKNLPGTYSDFHNSHSEAMRMDDPELGLRIAECGLTSYPNQGDLVADKIFALSSMGRLEEARTFFEQWRTKYPLEYRRAWRVIMFVGNLLGASALDEDAREAARTTLKEATDAMPHEVKVWAARSEFEANANCHEEAAIIVAEGRQLNPYSQQLCILLGKYFMVLGRAVEAKEQFLQGLRADHQDEFQHDVSQLALPSWLAQAYEACGEPEKAVHLYAHVVASSNSRSGGDFFQREYASNRLKALALLGVPGAAEVATPMQEAGNAQLMGLFQQLSAQRASQSGQGEESDE